MTDLVDCGDCPTIMGCPAGQCARSLEARHEEAGRRGQLDLLLDPARAERLAAENDARAMRLQQKRGDVASVIGRS